jgi:cytochrome c oxidase subunit 2
VTSKLEESLFQRVYLIPLAALSLAVLIAACAGTPEPGLARGEQIYDTCVPCHGKDGGGNQDLAAPAIAGMHQWYIEEQLTKFMTGMRGADPDDSEGHRMRPMARTLYRDGDVASVAEYVAKLPSRAPDHTLTGGDATAGEAKFALCIACHGPEGKGNELLHAPAIANIDDWYAFKQIKKFQSGMRGDAEGDIFGAQMRPMAMTLTSDQEIRDVLAYVRTLSK